MEEEDDSSSKEPEVEILAKKIEIVSKKKKQPEFGLIKEDSDDMEVATKKKK